MLRGLLVAGAIALTMTGLGLARAQAASPTTASVVGGGVLGIGGITFGTFHVSARSGPNGDSGSIGFRETSPDTPVQFWDVDVRCLNVVGNTAFATGVIVKASAGSIPGVGGFAGFLLKDGGNASTAPVDGFTTTFGVADTNPATACRSIDGPYFSFTNVAQGDILISSP